MAHVLRLEDGQAKLAQGQAITHGKLGALEREFDLKHQENVRRISGLEGQVGGVDGLAFLQKSQAVQNEKLDGLGRLFSKLSTVIISLLVILLTIVADLFFKIGALHG
jgi:hypothetical protein